MRFFICNSNNWFTLHPEINGKHEIIVISKKEDLTKQYVEKFQPDFIFFVHWNWFVDKDIYENYECVVFHTAPLPYGRGGSPIQNLILKGFNTSPVCALKMMGKLDAGPIYSQIEISLSDSLTSIFSRINDAINKLIVNIVENNPCPKKQRGQPHVFKRLSESDNEIPKNLSLREIYDRIRMLDHMDYPSAFIMHGTNKLEFSNASFNDQSLTLTCKIK